MTCVLGWQVLDGPTLGDIFSGKIQWWNDSNIRACNPNITLPNERITLALANDTFAGISQVFGRALAVFSPTFASFWSSSAAAEANWTQVTGISNNSVQTGLPGSAQISFVKARYCYVLTKILCNSLPLSQ